MDSLLNLLNETEIINQKVDLWNEISNQQQPISGKIAAQNALNLAIKNNYIQGQADANYYLGTYFYLKDEQDSAKSHFIDALSLYEQIDLKSGKTYTLIYLGEALYFEEQYIVALNYLKEAEHLATEIKDKSLLAMTYQTMAYIYIDGLKESELAENYLKKSITIFEQEKDTINLINGFSALASFYANNNQIDSSLSSIEIGENLVAQLNHSPFSVYMDNNFMGLKGTCYAINGAIDTAKFFIEQSLPFFIENENWFSVSWAYNDLALIAIKEENYKEALSFAKKSHKLDVPQYHLIKNIKIIRDAFKQLNQDSFYVYNEKYISILADAENIANVNKIQAVLKKEELSDKEKELANEKRISKIILIGVLLVSLLYGLSLLYFFKTKKIKPKVAKSNKATPSLKEKEIEIDTLRKKVHTIERSLLSKQIDIERQQSSIISTTQHLKEISAQNNPEELKNSIKKLSRQLENNQNNKLQWEFFIHHFEQIHPHFFHLLKQDTPNLSVRETRLCAFAKLGMTNQEMAQLLGIATSSVNKARHRLKKKMNLDKTQDLNQYLESLT